MEFVATSRAHNLMKLGVKELIELCIYCWGHPLLYTCSGSVAVWMLLSGNLQHLVDLHLEVLEICRIAELEKCIASHALREASSVRSIACPNCVAFQASAAHR